MLNRLTQIFTRDDASGLPQQRAIFFAPEKLGPNQSLTKEGYLVCTNVPIARTGIMYYGPGETTIPEVDGKVIIDRDEAELFAPKFMTSFVGKHVTNNHPPEPLSPQNFRNYAVGTIIATRRGDGIDDQLLLADMIIYDPLAISEIQDGKREVSAGYHTDYIETSPGRGRQINMLGNHVALVDAGRCGGQCAISDRKTIEGDIEMFARDQKTVSPKSIVNDAWSKMRAGIATAAAGGRESLDRFLADPANNPANLVMDEDPNAGGIHLHMGAGEGGRKMSDDDIEKRFGEMGEQVKGLADGMKGLTDNYGKINDMLGGIAAQVGYKAGSGTEGASDANKEIEGELKEEAPAGTGDAAAVAKDSQYLGDSFQEARSLGEILVPGIQVPTFDKAAKPKDSFDALCKFRRMALDRAYQSPEGKAVIDQLLAGKTFQSDKMSCASVRGIFRAAGNMRKLTNDTAARHAAQLAEANRNRDNNKPKAPTTAAELNEFHRKHYKQA
jgi:uncharacterized protein